MKRLQLTNIPNYETNKWVWLENIPFLLAGKTLELDRLEYHKYKISEKISKIELSIYQYNHHSYK